MTSNRAITILTDSKCLYVKLHTIDLRVMQMQRRCNYGQDHKKGRRSAAYHVC